MTALSATNVSYAWILTIMDNGDSEFNSGETATTSKDGRMDANYPIPAQGEVVTIDTDAGHYLEHLQLEWLFSKHHIE